jgi:hypothetical protein
VFKGGWAQFNQVRRNKLFPQKNTPTDMAQKERFFFAHIQIVVKCFDLISLYPAHLIWIIDINTSNWIRNLDDQSRVRCPEATARNLDEKPRAKRPVIHQTRAFPPLPPLILRPAHLADLKNVSKRADWLACVVGGWEHGETLAD